MTNSTLITCQVKKLRLPHFFVFAAFWRESSDTIPKPHRPQTSETTRPQQRAAVGFKSSDKTLAKVCLSRGLWTCQLCGGLAQNFCDLAGSDATYAYFVQIVGSNGVNPFFYWTLCCSTSRQEAEGVQCMGCMTSCESCSFRWSTTWRGKKSRTRRRAKTFPSKQRKLLARTL